MEPIILASESQRRQDFFKLMGLPFTVLPAGIDETPQRGLSPRQAAEDLALRKTAVIVERIKNAEITNNNPIPHSSFLISNSSPLWIFAADTIVVLDGKIYGKPENRDDAGRMLRSLAGRRHEVVTAMALYSGRDEKTDCRSVTCEVLFAPLSPAGIEWYLDTDEWQGAAGAYRLQETGGCLIKGIHGSPSAVAGLPLHDFYVMLRDNGYPFGA